MVEKMSLLITRCLYWGQGQGWGFTEANGGIRGDGVGVHLTKHQPDPETDDMPCWPSVVLLLTTRCLYWGGGVKGADRRHTGVRGHWGLHMKNEDGLLQSTLENSRWSIADNRTWAQVNGTQVHTTLGHQMPLPGRHWGGIWGWWGGGTSEKTSAWPTAWWHVILNCSSTTLDH